MIEGAIKMPNHSRLRLRLLKTSQKTRLEKKKPSGKQTEVTNVDTPRKADMEPENHIHLPSTSI